MITNDIKAKDKSVQKTDIKPAVTADKKEAVAKEAEAVKKSV